MDYAVADGNSTLGTCDCLLSIIPGMLVHSVRLESAHKVDSRSRIHFIYILSQSHPWPWNTLSRREHKPTANELMVESSTPTKA